MDWTTVRAWLAGLFGLALLFGLLFVGFVALLVVVPIAVVAFLVLRHRMAKRMSTMQTTSYTWTSEGVARRSTDIEGVVVNVKVERPSDDDGDRPTPQPKARKIS
ncbi:MAG: hypothetical protein WD673_14045 [Alphaproteobacteria bacterium]